MATSFSSKISKHFLNLINAGCNPIAQQFMVSDLENQCYSEELADPIGDLEFSPVPGIVHRYNNRVLLLLTFTCVVHCRFCFRRNRVGSNPNLSVDKINNAIAYIAKNPNINEVILTGGDPFVCSPKILTQVLQQLNNIEHIKSIRIHTRVPFAEPSLINGKLIKVLSSFSKPIWCVAHINSHYEITGQSKQAILKLRQAGIILLSQSVLLRNVNDSVNLLQSLFEGLIAIGVKPYYLHYPDLAQGTSHFRIKLELALELFTEVSKQLSGIAIPNFIVDLPNGQGKVSLNKSIFTQIQQNEWEFVSPLTGKKVTVKYP